LNMKKRPRLVYLNGCDSAPIGRALQGCIPMTIGTTAPISNRGAMAAALLFYDRLLTGHTVQVAFDAGRALIKTIDGGAVGASTELFVSAGIFPDREYLYPVPRIVASFEKDDYTPSKNGDFPFAFGVWGCPAGTKPLLIYTNDESFIDLDQKEEDEWADCDDDAFHASQLCYFIRNCTPQNGVIWSSMTRRTYVDYRLFATGVDGSGRTFATSSTLCDALESYWELCVRGQPPPKGFLKAVAQLRANED
jgi:hypothetical protein